MRGYRTCPTPLLKRTESPFDPSGTGWRVPLQPGSLKQPHRTPTAASEPTLLRL